MPDTSNDGHPMPPSETELNSPLPVRPDPRQPAYDAVYEYIRGLGPYLPPDPVHRNAIIWRAVHAALDATHLGRCVSSHCVEGDHMVLTEEWSTPADSAVTAQPTGCRCHTGDELCSSCRRCPDICNGCDGPEYQPAD
jgi:hypothetical protein